MKTLLIALLFLVPVTTFGISTGTTTYPTKTDKVYPTFDKTKTTTTYDKTKTATYDKTKHAGTVMSEADRQQEMIRLQNLIAQLLQQLIALLQIQQKALGQ